jgi:(+)-trans-carveol dehydrogenase
MTTSSTNQVGAEERTVDPVADRAMAVGAGRHGLEGRVALVTGAARGQGRSHAVALAREGTSIIALDACASIETVPYPMPTQDDLSETRRQVEELGVRCAVGVCDVRDAKALTAEIDRGVGELGRLDIVCANAGIVSFGIGHELSEDAWTTMIDINLNGVWRTCKAAVSHLLAGGRGGSVIITSSVAGLGAASGLAHYVAAKHGLTGLAKAMALELAGYGIRVNTLNPTQVDTPMIQNRAMYTLFLPDELAPTREQFAAASGSLIPLPVPWVESADVTNAVLFLASDASRFITGSTIPIDGGALLQ